MAEEPQNYPPITPQQVPPVMPTQAYPASQPTPYAQQPYTTMPPQQYAPTQQYTPAQQSVPQQYAPMPPQPMSVTSAQGKPIRKGKGGSAALVWLLGCAGLFAIVFIVGIAYFTMNVGSTISSSTRSLPGAQQKLEEIRAALDTYTAAHQGQYPASLDKIVDANALVYTSKTGEKVHVEYTPPTAASPQDAGVAGFYLGDMMKFQQLMDQKLYIRLLKNGVIVQEQITRSPLPDR